MSFSATLIVTRVLKILLKILIELKTQIKRKLKEKTKPCVSTKISGGPWFSNTVKTIGRWDYVCRFPFDLHLF